MPRWFPLPIPFACSLALAVAAPATAQDEAVVDAVAAILAAEDARRYDQPLLANAAAHPEPLVRRYAALAMGRIGNPAAAQPLLTLVNDPDSTVRAAAVFALGLVGDRAVIPSLGELVRSAPIDGPMEVPLEAVTAIAKLGGTDAAAFFNDFLVRWIGAGSGTVPPTVARALWASWRLGTDGAPLDVLESFAQSPSVGLRTPALYALMRLGAPRAANLFLSATADADPYIRSLAARALTRGLAQDGGLDPRGTATRLTRLVEDPDERVRINALRSLATFEDPSLAPAVASRATDGEPNVRVQALATLGELGGRTAGRTLEDHLTGGSFATRSTALLSLAKVDRRRALVGAARWITAGDWDRRMVGARALGVIGGDTAEAWLEDLLRDPDGRVIAGAMQALTAADSARAAAHARRFLLHPDAVVRTLAARHVGAAPTLNDIATLAEAFTLGGSDSIPDARIAIVRALAAYAERGLSERMAVEDAFLTRFPACDDYLVRRTAQEVFPAAAAQWGPATPIETRRSIGDYRDIARRFVVPSDRSDATPGLLIETERGQLEIDLYAADAPLTVQSFLQLVDARYFDNRTWHRVVPNVVIQDGDPRGDGWGGPPFRVRDEVNRHRYERGSVGIALSGADTGGSQFFITMDRQPHLDGTYTIIGRVSTGADVVPRIMQGERIRTVRRR